MCRCLCHDRLIINFNHQRLQMHDLHLPVWMHINTHGLLVETTPHSASAWGSVGLHQ